MTCSFILQPARWVSAAECLCVGGAVTLCEGGGSDISDRNHDTRGGGCVSSEDGGREGGGSHALGGRGMRREHVLIVWQSASKLLCGRMCVPQRQISF